MPLVQGRKRRPQAEDESPEGSPGPETQRRRMGNASEDEDYGGAASAATQAGDVEEMGRKLVRLALACEYQRKPIRRADIGEKVLGTHVRQFKHVFQSAQTHLRSVFGMEMCELPAKEKITVQQKRAAQKSGSQAKPTTSWMLVSILPSEFRSPDVIPPPSAPTAADEGKYTAIYTILVSTIMLYGGNLPDAKMDAILRKLGLEDNTPIQDYERTEKLLKRLEKDGYILKIRESNGTGEDDIYWVVGPRGKVEINEGSVRGLAGVVYRSDQMSEEEQAELERQIQRSLSISDRAQPEQNGEQQPAQKRPKPQKKGKKNAREEEHEEESDEDDDEDDD